ncbi:MAG TPA: Crp/Fnr family transcriptional regulator [Zoogloea sp.]|uniref:Crp/Fnr family transcriptional regulator n=1 Tax=Zoogloea sp. TaxID=49181 RepID=UPI002BF45BA4|nr:Crp/Fnr family transcriptional regulator [Zoogloea sp.]HMV16705.1 Crp/Fnr family transcriptional regulator [Rhodocyclaceae bacterium]HMV61857.1 Crp/Fnr family transcriptional regulator [Rhodocyclaceae bacterium]HMW52137.1 Crp/Fnr family transcriptional regulator [Rhodocyclaceae bacterium]HMY48115.1 Crp/Fnr family transcriptional regulator [Rhodocyclaceae bacterium]HMZ74678.1 Crp/Fnr family transcriptional regulator [Rhodocyclaceae bacterium]
MKTSPVELSAVLPGIRLFAGLDPRAVAELSRAGHVATLPKGRGIYATGELPRALYYLLSGQVKVAVTSAEGGEKVIDIVHAPQAFGVAELFGQAPHVSSAETVGASVVLVIGREGVMRAIEYDARLSMRLLQTVADRQTAIERDIAADCFQSGCEKVVDYLLRAVAPAAGWGDSVSLDLEIPKYLLAARLGFTPETLSRIFRELSDEGLIRVHGRRVELLGRLLRRHGVVPAQVRPPRSPERGRSGQAVAWA